MYKVQITNKYQKDYIKACKRKLNLTALDDVVEILEKNGKLPSLYKPHKLSGNLEGLWECHVKSDWLLFWTQDEKSKTITLIATGTHSDLL